MELYNSLTGKREKVEAKDGKVRIYSCGPTVYERAHIGNLSSFIYADTLKRALEAGGQQVEHVMNITDVDDKTIRNSREQYPDLPPAQALKQLTARYERLFMDDLEAVGIDASKIKFVRATENIDAMQELIKMLLDARVAYEAEDGIYFSIDEYQKRGKKYGQLLDINTDNTSHSRIDNDEYDKDSPQDFVLWKAKKEGEPAWDFEVNGKNIAGRPGWHIECSAMSVKYLGQPFDIHTGGVDLKFPHHENEIAQSTAIDGDLLARLFFHSEHMLVDNQKMSKSLNNFLTLEDVVNKGFDPLAFRLLVLEGKYTNQRDFSWDNLDASAARLARWRRFADLRYQVADQDDDKDASLEVKSKLLSSLNNDLDAPESLRIVDEVLPHIESHPLSEIHLKPLESLLGFLDKVLGLNLMERKDISNEQKRWITEREAVRQNKDWQKSDELRAKLEQQGIGINDTDAGSIWYRL